MRVDKLVELCMKRIRSVTSIIDEERLKNIKRHKILYYILLCCKMFDIVPPYSSIYSCLKSNIVFTGNLYVETIDEQSINKFELIMIEIINSLGYIFVIKSIIWTRDTSVHVILSDDYCDFYMDIYMSVPGIKNIDYFVIDTFIHQVEMRLNNVYDFE